MIDKRTLRCKQEYEGKIFKTRNTNNEFIIKEFIDSKHVVIKFEDADLELVTTMNQIRSGLLDPFEKSCIWFPNKQLEYVGNTYKTNQGYLVKLIEYNTCDNITVQFLDNYGHITKTTLQNLKNGEVRNPYHRNKFGGYMGVGEYNGDKYDWLYNRWMNMLIRANCTEYYRSYHEYDTEAYDNTYLDERWFCYNNFANWFMNTISRLNPNYNYDIDKDLLYPYYSNKTNGKKCYGPDTCLLIPHDLNVLISDSSIYDKTKEIYKLSSKLLEDNAIDINIFNLVKKIIILPSRIKTPRGTLFVKYVIIIIYYIFR